jgi:hypothetical protein
LDILLHEGHIVVYGLLKSVLLEPCVIAHVCNSSYFGKQRLKGLRQDRAKSYQDLISVNMPGMVMHAFGPNYRGSIDKRIQVESWSGHKLEILPEK